MSVPGSLAVMRNAFSTATASAKIPDGSVSHSITERAATASAVLSPAGRVTFILAPSLTTHIQYSTDSPPPNSTAVLNVTSVPNDNHTVATDGDASVAGKGNIDQWRMVSAGLRLACINGSDTLNGWFEAIRVTSSYTVEADTTGILEAGFESNILNSPNWANHPSYVTGRLRDIGKHTFYCQPTERYQFSKTGACFDKNYDIVLVRCYSLASDQAAQQTGLHYHVIHNYELCYDANSSLSRFQTGCPVFLKGVEGTRRAMTKDVKASMIRAASAYAYR